MAEIILFSDVWFSETILTSSDQNSSSSEILVRWPAIVTDRFLSTGLTFSVRGQTVLTCHRGEPSGRIPGCHKAAIDCGLTKGRIGGEGGFNDPLSIV